VRLYLTLDKPLIYLQELVRYLDHALCGFASKNICQILESLWIFYYASIAFESAPAGLLLQPQSNLSLSLTLCHVGMASLPHACMLYQGRREPPKRVAFPVKAYKPMPCYVLIEPSNPLIRFFFT
jgi:hypothetical protein